MSRSPSALAYVVAGAIVMAYAVASLFFLRFWRHTRDRLFVVFALAFALLAVQRLALVDTRYMIEIGTGLYLLRLSAYLLILAAIVDKNRSGDQAPPA